MSQEITLFESRWLGIYQIDHWEFTRRPNADGCVGVLAVTDHDEIVLIEQFRIPLGRRVIEIPAGLVGDESEHLGESLVESAKRELLEETGYLAHEVKKLISSPTSAGMTSEYTHLFLAKNLIRKNSGGGVRDEKISVHVIARKELRAFLSQKETEGLVIDFKIHACLASAGIAF